MSGNKNTGFPGEGSFVVKRNAKGKGKHSNFIVTNENATDDGPTHVFIKFPDFSKMDCAQLNEQIINMKEYLSTPTLIALDPDVIVSYQNAIKAASQIFESKGCLVKTNGYGEINQVENGEVKTTAVIATDPITKKETVIGTVKNELSSVTSDVKNTVSAALKTDTAKKAFPWLVVVAVVGVGYLILRK